MGGWVLQEASSVRCPICRNGSTREGDATVTLTRGGLTLVVKHVPAEVCDNCGEEYVDDRTAASLLDVAEASERAGVEVDVRDYAAA